MQSDPRITTPAVSTNENMLHTLGRKVSAGRELTLAEDLMARTAAARYLRGNYGPATTVPALRKCRLAVRNCRKASRACWPATPESSTSF